ncbi:MAG: SHOCT domain-containing protein, partial [Cyanobacteriota bacterium]|nr:SHOCT domain-containing protein [Cyanobacteriota bacterium]
RISGCSLADGEDGGALFTTNAGTIPLARLPEVRLGAAAPPVDTAAGPSAGPSIATAGPPPPAEGPGENPQAAVLDALAKLGDLKEKGILTEEEFTSKKAELLRRL